MHCLRRLPPRGSPPGTVAADPGMPQLFAVTRRPASATSGLLPYRKQGAATDQCTLGDRLKSGMARSSSSAFASFKSGVSKPSVNRKARCRAPDQRHACTHRHHDRRACTACVDRVGNGIRGYCRGGPASSPCEALQPAETLPMRRSRTAFRTCPVYEPAISTRLPAWTRLGTCEACSSSGVRFLDRRFTGVWRWP